MKENKIEKRLATEIEKIKGLALKLNSQSANGVPDRLVLLPNGRAYFIELKSPGQDLDPLQRYWKRKLKELGFISIKIDNLVGVEKFIEKVKRGDI